jgi:hypothetical protein
MADRKARKKECRLALPEYKCEIVGDDLAQAKKILRSLRRGISKAADVCEISPPVCVDNLGLTRDRMPQIEGEASVVELLEDVNTAQREKGQAILAAGAKRVDTRTILDQFLDRLERAKVRTKRERVLVGTLKATQAEIQAAKVVAMADAHLRGLFPGLDKQIVVSRDDYILDGHHRWAALMSIDPKRYMSVLRVSLPMRELLHEAAATPGVYRASFAGRPLPNAEQRAYKRDHKSKLGRRRSARPPVGPAERRRALSRAVAAAM